MTRFAAAPPDLIAELEAAGLDPDALWQQVTGALAEDLPGGGTDVTSMSTREAPAVAT